MKSTNGITVNESAKTLTLKDDNLNPNPYNTVSVTSGDYTLELASGSSESKTTSNTSNSGTSNISKKNNSFVNNKNTKAKVTINVGDNSTVNASGGTDENINLKDSKNSVVIVENGANVENYDPSNGTAFWMNNFSNILSAIRSKSLTFDNNNIRFSGKKNKIQ